MKKPWSEAEIASVVEWYASGVCETEIANRLGRTVGSVSNIRQARRIHRPADKYVSSAPWSAADLELAKSLYEAGIDRSIIARRVSRSSIAIKRMADQEGWIRPSVFGVSPSWFDTDVEEWRAACFDGYAVSSLGNVMSLFPCLAGRLLKKWRDADGYDHVTLTVDGSSVRKSVHRLVAVAFLPEPPVGKDQVAHRNGVPWDNAASNLRWATGQENQLDRLDHGTALRRGDGKFLKVWAGDRIDDVRCL